MDPCKRIKKWSDRIIGLVGQYNINDRAGLWLISSGYDAIDSEFPWEWRVNYCKTVERLNNCISISFGSHNVLLEKHAQTIHTGKGSCESSICTTSLYSYKWEAPHVANFNCSLTTILELKPWNHKRPQLFPVQSKEQFFCSLSAGVQVRSPGNSFSCASPSNHEALVASP